jgi:hypothetical protein
MILFLLLLPLMVSCYYFTIVTHPGSPVISIDKMENGLTREFRSVELKRNGRVIRTFSTISRDFVPNVTIISLIGLITALAVLNVC